MEIWRLKTEEEIMEAGNRARRQKERLVGKLLVSMMVHGRKNTEVHQRRQH